MIALALLLAGTPIDAPGSAPILAQVGQPPVEVWQLDQIRIPRNTPEKKLKLIEPAHTLDAVIAVLKEQKIEFARGKAALLPDRLPEKVRADILALPAGEPFVLPEADFISISVLIGRKLPPGVVSYRPRPAPFPARKA